MPEPPPKYAGIGPRKAPDWVVQFCQVAAEALAWKGYRLRSGHAEGCDEAFEEGAAQAELGLESEIYLPWPTFRYDEAPTASGVIFERPASAAYDIARRHHPSWAILKRGAKALHARNAHILLGPKLDDPVKFVLTWTEKGNTDGSLDFSGTGMMLRLAAAYNVPVFNYGDPQHERRVDAMLSEYLAAQA